ncbi:MAG: alginate lyase family protein [Bacteroidales bacterium]|nr:alginate lyase family protein [Bacteroidales bacterium]
MKRFSVIIAAAAMSLFSFTAAGQDTLSLSFCSGGKANLKGGTWIEAQTPCDLKIVMSGDEVSEITVFPKGASNQVEFVTNRPWHMANNHVTTIWDDQTGTERIIVRVPKGKAVSKDSFKIQDGPITSDEKFFSEALNLDYPGLEDVKKAVAAKDWLGARTAYVKHLKTRTTPVWFFDWRDFGKGKEEKETSIDQDGRVYPANTEAADKAASNYLTSCSVPYQFGSHVNWSINPTPLVYNEWTWQLSRHAWWETLGTTYWATKDEKYAKAFVSQMRGWVIDNPLPSYAANDAFSRWRTIETGIRTLGHWPEAFFRFLPSPSFDDESILMMVKSFYEHGVHLSAFPSKRGNWLTMEMNGLYHVAVLFPEFKDSPEWEKQSSETLYKEENVQVYPDGAQFELAPGYHGVSLNSILGPWRLARINGKELPGDYVKNIEKMYSYYLNILMPDRKMPGMNDSGWGSAVSKLREGAGYFPERTDLLYAASYGSEGKKPSFTSVWMPWAGWYIMRSGWDKDAKYAHFEVGPYSAGHSHEDKLSLILSAYGNRILTECGSYAYDTSQWRAYALSARAHNLTRVDGMDQNRRRIADKDGVRIAKEPLTNRWKTNSKFDFGEGWYDEGFGPKGDSTVTQYRSLVFLKDKCWLLFDVFTPSDKASHTYETSFHLNAPEASIDEKLQAVTGKKDGAAVLSVVPLRSGSSVKVITGQEVPEVQGWVHDEECDTYEDRPVATPIFKREAKGQWVEPYLLYPLKAGEECPVASVASDGEGTYTVVFKDGAVMTVKLKVSGNSLQKLSYSIKGGKEGSVSAKVL